MLVVGGAYQGGAYDPASDRWWPLSMQGAPTLTEALVVWTGRHMLFWGFGDMSVAGARYEP